MMLVLTERRRFTFTVGVLQWTWTDVLLEAIADVSLNDSIFRQALPLGFAKEEFNRERAREIFRELLTRLSAKCELDAILDRFTDEFISLCPPLLRGQLGQLANLDRVALDTVVGSRTGVIAHVRTNRDGTTIDCYGREITFPAQATEGVRFALSNSKFAVFELPGGLDDTGKLILVRRLIREGLLMVLQLEGVRCP